jgi:hypothetical protein
MTNPYLEGSGDLSETDVVKKRVEVQNAELVVTEAKPGTVSFGDKVKKYYKGLIALVGALLVLVNQVTPLTNFLGEDTQNLVSVVIVFLTAVATFLKSNEQWVDKL